jgi:hypothetical protein
MILLEIWPIWNQIYTLLCQLRRAIILQSYSSVRSLSKAAVALRFSRFGVSWGK